MSDPRVPPPGGPGPWGVQGLPGGAPPSPFSGGSAPAAPPGAPIPGVPIPGVPIPGIPIPGLPGAGPWGQQPPGQPGAGADAGPWGTQGLPGGSPQNDRSADPSWDAPTRPIVDLPPIASTDFIAAQRANRRATRVLLLCLTLLAAGLGYLAGWTMEATGGSAPRGQGIWFVSAAGIVFALGMVAVSLIWSAVSLSWGSRMVLSMAGGREVTVEEERRLFNVVEEMRIASGLPMPRVFVIEEEALNAFATGASPDRAAVAVTRGLLQRLNREELQGVIGHEMAHIANMDTRYMTVVGVTVGLIALVSEMILRSLNWGGRRSGRRENNGAAIILVVVLVFVALLAPLAARMVQFAVSRQREYLADATSVRFTRNPTGLISALRQLTAEARPFSGVSGATQHLFIVNPLRQFSSKASALMATHPATEDRIDRLTRLGRR